MTISMLRFAIGFAGAATLLWPQAMVEYSLGVARAGTAASVIPTQPLKSSLQQTGRAVADRGGRGARRPTKGGKAVGLTYSLEDEAAYNRQKLAARAGETAALLDVTAPDGAVISLDSSVVGRGTSSLKLAPGKYRVRVASPGYVVVDEQVELHERDSLQMKVRLERAMSSGNVIQIGAGARSNQ